MKRKIKRSVKWIQENLKVVEIIINRCTQDGIIVKKIFEKKKKIWRKIKGFVKWIQENLKIVKILINRCNTQDGIIVKKNIWKGKRILQGKLKDLLSEFKKI